MSKRSRIILLSCITVLCCVALMVGGTFALFTYNRSVTNHLQAGKLTATLTRTKLETVTLDGSTGELKSRTSTETVDFTAESTGNVFGLTDGDRVAPGCKYAATMKLANTGTVAFVYWIEIDLKAGDSELTEQLQLTVSVTDGESKTTLLSAEPDEVTGSAAEPLGTILIGKDSEFTVTLEFKSEAENAAQSKSANFDLIVHAQQVTTAE